MVVTCNYIFINSVQIIMRDGCCICCLEKRDMGLFSSAGVSVEIYLLIHRVFIGFFP